MHFHTLDISSITQFFFISYLYHTSPTSFSVSHTIFRENSCVAYKQWSAFTQLLFLQITTLPHWFWVLHSLCLVFLYEGESKSKGKVHLTALIEVTVSNFTYHFFLHSPFATQCICYIVQLISVFLQRRSFSAALVVLCAWCWWLTRKIISNTCSIQFKPFHPFINLSKTHGVLSILSQHTTVNFHRFRSFCPKKPHYATLFCDAAILQRSVHVFALIAATRLKAERCTAHGWTL